MTSAPWLVSWLARAEPDTHARRYASDAMDAIDAALVGVYAVSARLVAEIRASDDASAARD